MLMGALTADIVVWEVVVVAEREAPAEEEEEGTKEVEEDPLSPSFVAVGGLTTAGEATVAAAAAVPVAVVTLVVVAFMGNSAAGAREVLGWRPRDSSSLSLFGGHERVGR